MVQDYLFGVRIVIIVTHTSFKLQPTGRLNPQRSFSEEAVAFKTVRIVIHSIIWVLVIIRALAVGHSRVGIVPFIVQVL